MLTLQNVAVRYGNKKAAEDVSFSIEPGQWWIVAGLNGAGKTTLVNAIARSVPFEGAIRWEGREILSFSPGEYARRVGVLSQMQKAEYAFTVEEVVALGRYAYQGSFLRHPDEEGEKRIDDALRLTGLHDMRHRRLTTLSGGETQRVFLAQVFAQDPRLLLLDEPANHLDLVYQKQVFSLIRDWALQPGRAVLSVVHDLSLARRYGTHAVLMDQGKCAAQGKTGDVLSWANLRRVYRMDVYEWMQDLLAQWQ